jgi:hypothetical protein
MVVLAALAAVSWIAISRETSPVRTAASPRSRVTPSESLAPPSSKAAPFVEDDAAPVLAPLHANGARVSARWGAGQGELGRSRPQEGNPEGPMSLVRAGDDLLVLDQVNARVVRYDAKGDVRASFDATLTTQDIAVGKDGHVVLLDRLVDKAAHIVDRNGRPIGSLPLPADRVGDPGLVTGVFVDGKDVYVEKEHGVLTRIGTTDGSAADPAELAGRPSKDGSLLLLAALSAPEARVSLNAFDRRLGSLRFTRAITFPRPARQIALLDSDLRGTIYLGVVGGNPQMVHVACLDPTDGHAIGRVVLQTSAVPEESFRDFSVADDGTLVMALRSEDGVEYQSAHCP